MRKSITPLLILLAAFSLPATTQIKLNVEWDKQVRVSRSVPTLQVVVNPMLRKGSPIHDQSFKALKDLQADYVRYVPWLPYPRLGVAELEPPTAKSTSWDFSVIDPMTIDFLEATKGHPVVINFSTVPQWMYKTDHPVTYPENPDEVVWNYTQGNTPRDTTWNEIANYYARLISWYTKGGFKDELGKYHPSGHSYSIPYWEVMNEPDLEHHPTPEQYTKQYDAIVSAVKKVAPQTKFVGISVAFETDPHWFEYFLNPKNHRPGIPLDMISYHFYATSSRGQMIDDMQYTYFERANGFLNMVRYIENIRKRLSPNTKTTINEVGSILHNEEEFIPDQYWNLSGALYAYLYIELTKIGIDIIGESQLVGYPSQFPSVSMMNWKNGKPNARYWVLKLLKDNFGPGDVLVNATSENDLTGSLTMQAFRTKSGNKLLLINRHNKTLSVTVPEAFAGGKLTRVDGTTGDNEPATSAINSATIEMKPFSVAVVKK
jgi:Glycosyl hydrolases family 39